MLKKEKPHRLPKEYYRGVISVAFTLCVKDNYNRLDNKKVVDTFCEVLKLIAAKYNCIIPVYCYMPNHQHVIVSGLGDDSDIWKVITEYKQKTGYVISKNKWGFKWQKDFYDHIIRENEDLRVQVKYILANPVRKGLVEVWQDYPYKGCINCNMEEILEDIPLI